MVVFGYILILIGLPDGNFLVHGLPAGSVLRSRILNRPRKDRPPTIRHCNWRLVAVGLRTMDSRLPLVTPAHEVRACAR
jgi:hypothetical protein